MLPELTQTQVLSGIAPSRYQHLKNAIIRLHAYALVKYDHDHVGIFSDKCSSLPWDAEPFQQDDITYTPKGWSWVNPSRLTPEAAHAAVVAFLHHPDIQPLAKNRTTKQQEFHEFAQARLL